MPAPSDAVAKGQDTFATSENGCEDRAGGLEVIALKQIDALAEYEDAWRRLEKLSKGQFAYFQSYDWCVTWCRHYLSDAGTSKRSELSVFVVKRDGDVVMIWPMLQTETILGVRSLTFIGDELGQYSSIVLDCRAVTDRDVAAVWKKVLTLAKPDVVELDHVPATAMLASVHKEAGISIPKSTTALMDLSSIRNREDLEASFNSTTRRNRRKRRNKLAAGERLVLEQVDGGSREFRDLTRLAFAWKREWLSHTGRFNRSVADDRALRFISSLSDGAVALVLKRAGVPVALEIGFVRCDHYYSYMGAFDWSLNRLSPGKVQMDEALSWLIDNKLRYFDLLGNPSSYKQDWSNIEIGLQTILHPLTLKGHAYAVGWRRHIKPRLKTCFYLMPLALRVWLLGQVGRPKRAGVGRAAARTPGESAGGRARWHGSAS